jgi:dipeptidyl aminopeptidase/acylaminoacyl peptidase
MIPASGISARSVTWRNDGFDVQGWLLQPADSDPGLKRPMVVLVHGGPEAASTNKFPPPSSDARMLLEAGWDVFEPNYRGSFGQGETFAAASIQDLGGGDWRDVLTGVDAAERLAPIDDSRVGIMGRSYGGYMVMWGITQTHRFRAAVAHAGVSDWVSIEGEAPQAGSDEVNFGGSVYDDATPYLEASPIMHMRGVNTPTLLTVGERDLECPMPQSEEFYTALVALGVPVEFHVYPGEGHHLEKAEDRADFRKRAVGWFQRWFAAATASAH